MDIYLINLLDNPTSEGFMPTMKAYISEHQEACKRPMIVICPGGAYADVSLNWEGERVAMAYVAAGFHAAVVDYCTSPHRHPLPIRNVAEAIRLCRQNAAEWQVDEQQIVVCGFSAGGHLAASISTLWNATDIFTQEEIDSEIYRPNATILCYPVITSGDKAHKNSFQNLLGSSDESIPEWQQLSVEQQVDERTPPAFLWHTFEDALVPVENSMYYAMALRQHQVPFELHVYPKGWHGLSLATRELPRTKSVFGRDYGWMKLSIDWLGEVFEL